MDTQGMLFNDSEIFQKERPVKLTEKQYDDLLTEMAREINENEWSYDDIEVIVSDLKCLYRHSNGYERAKQLEGFNCKGDYDIDADFVDWLDSFDSRYDDILEQNVKQWVKAHDIKPKFSIGDALINKGQRVMYVNYVDVLQAMYGISSENGSRRNTLFKFEDIERIWTLKE